MTNLPPYLEDSANLVYAAPFYFKVFGRKKKNVS